MKILLPGLDLNTPFGVENVIDENSDDGGSPIGEITQSEVNFDELHLLMVVQQVEPLLFQVHYHINKLWTTY